MRALIRPVQQLSPCRQKNRLVTVRDAGVRGAGGGGGGRGCLVHAGWQGLSDSLRHCRCILHFKAANSLPCEFYFNIKINSILFIKFSFNEVFVPFSTGWHMPSRAGHPIRQIWQLRLPQSRGLSFAAGLYCDSSWRRIPSECQILRSQLPTAQFLPRAEFPPRL